MSVNISDSDARLLVDKLPAVLRAADAPGTRFQNSKRLLALMLRRLEKKINEQTKTETL